MPDDPHRPSPIDVSIERTVPCPVCRRPAIFGPRNQYRPFCSERCRDVDLGAWTSEGYRVAPETASEDRPGGELPARH